MKLRFTVRYVDDALEEIVILYVKHPAQERDFEDA